jgi:tetratricopeptide (TPR) repeat protein
MKRFTAICLITVGLIGLLSIAIGYRRDTLSRHSVINRSDVLFWRDAVREKPRDFKAHYFLAAALMEEGRWTEAEAELNRCLALSPNNTSVWYKLGCLHEAQGDIATARPFWRKALSAKSQSLQQEARSKLAQYPPHAED